MRIPQRALGFTRRSKVTRASRAPSAVLGSALLAVAVVPLLSTAAAADQAPTTTQATAVPSTSTTTQPAGSSPSTSTTTQPTGSTKVTGTTQSTGATKRSGLDQRPNASGSPISGTGSSFASPAIETWISDVKNSPYGITLNWAPSNSGQGRYNFTNQTDDFAVSDTGYVGGTDTQPPSFPFNFIPITAGGIAFMYNVPGLPKQLQLSSYTACALLTGGIKTWNDSHIAADNPGVSLPSTAVVPVTESDPAGTNYVLEEWCIDEQPALWQAFVQAQESQSGGATVPISPTSPNSAWPGIYGGLNDQSTTSVASDVSNHPGAIGPVQVKYANDLGFGGADPTKNVALVKNASGDYTAPSPTDVASALAYATQQSNGTHELNFNGAGPHVYNPSTYSYLLTPTTGWAVSKGATMSQFVDYVLTLGQQEAPKFGYASLGLSLEQYGVKAVQANVPGAVPPTAAEQQAYACGDLTPAEVAAGQTTPTCGVVNATAGPPGANAGTATGSGAAGAGSHTLGASGGSGSGGSGGSGGGGAAGADPGVALTGSPTMAGTGIDAVPVTILGICLFLIGVVGRRRMLKRRAGDIP